MSGGSGVAGQPGRRAAAKTVYAGQFLAEGLYRGEPGVFVTLEEPAEDLRANLRTLGLEVAAWEQPGGDRRWTVPQPPVGSGPAATVKHGPGPQP